MTTYQLWSLCFSIFQFLVTSGVGLYVWWTRKQTVTSARFNDLEKRLVKLETTFPEALEKRLIVIEEAVKHPVVCSHHSGMEANDKALFKRLDEMHGDLRELAGSLKGINRAVDLINQFLIEQGGKK